MRNIAMVGLAVAALLAATGPEVGASPPAAVDTSDMMITVETPAPKIEIFVLENVAVDSVGVAILSTAATEKEVGLTAFRGTEEVLESITSLIRTENLYRHGPRAHFTRIPLEDPSTTALDSNFMRDGGPSRISLRL